jgi:hypothetical protein
LNLSSFKSSIVSFSLILDLWLIAVMFISIALLSNLLVYSLNAT